jgi:GH25 family lysozyme M1 (1,4-beta-N-acetylmuramidase)
MNITDLSKYQGTIDFAKLSKVVDFVILRVQSGYTVHDSKYNEYVTGCKQYGIPFGTYAYFKGVSVPDSIAEAKSALELMDPDSKFFALDIEENCNRDLVGTGQAFIDYLKNKGVQKVGLYSGESFFNSHNLSNIKCDFTWIAKYGSNDGQPHTKPSVPCDLWQYTSVGKLDGITGNVDLNQLTGTKDKTFFIGKSPRTIHFYTGGYGGQGLADIHSFITSKKWWFKAERKDEDGSIMLTIGGFAEGSDAANEMENYLKTKNCWYEIQ